MGSTGWILVYTRTPVPHNYPMDLASSVHFAYSRDGTNFTALNRNYGILFALAAIDANNVIHARGLKQPYIFATADGQYGIVAVKPTSTEAVIKNLKAKWCCGFLGI